MKNMQSRYECSACHKLFTDGDNVLVPVHIPRIAGLESRKIDTVRFPDGTEVEITEYASCCGNVDCLRKVLDDPSWVRTDWAAKRQRMRERVARQDEAAAANRAETEARTARTEAITADLRGAYEAEHDFGLNLERLRFHPEGGEVFPLTPLELEMLRRMGLHFEPYERIHTAEKAFAEAYYSTWTLSR